MDVKGTKKRKSVDKRLCKYGLSCYQKNPEHRKKFKHPTENETKVTDHKFLNEDSLKENAELSLSVIAEVDTSQAPMTEETKLDESDEQSIAEDVDDSLEETVDDILKSMPKDFFDFWKFCTSVKNSKPEDAFSKYGYHLVGVFDLLAKNLPKKQKVDISCHWRYFYDPPEFQTIIKKDGKEQFHIGYFRDDPSEKPLILASNSAIDCTFDLMGDNVFCAMNAELNKVIKSLTSKSLKDEATKLQKDLMKFAASKKYSLSINSEKAEKRQKKVVARTFNHLGIVVPMKNDIGYRPLPDSDATLKTILRKIKNSSENKTKQLKEREALDEIISNVHFANDECDYGMGLELGIDLFCDGNACFHGDVLKLLTVAYDLLNRSKYAVIIKAHLKNRRKKGNLSTL